MATAQGDRDFVMEIVSYFPDADAAVVGNREARDSYLKKVQGCFQIREALPRAYVSSVYNAFIVREGDGAGIYKRFSDIPTCFSKEEHNGIIPFRNCCEAECWWKDVIKEKPKTYKIASQRPTT